MSLMLEEEEGIELSHVETESTHCVSHNCTCS